MGAHGASQPARQIDVLARVHPNNAAGQVTTDELASQTGRNGWTRLAGRAISRWRQTRMYKISCQFTVWHHSADKWILVHDQVKMHDRVIY